MTETIGQQLRQARKSRLLTLEEVSQTTHMRIRYLQALEADDIDSIPSIAQARGFLRSYANFLGLEADSLLNSLAGASVDLAAPAVDELNESSISRERRESEPDVIFAEIGQKLKHQRELLGLSLDDVERHTHVRTHYLIAIEEGDLAGLPSPVQGRGMLSNYARFLGMDPEPLLLRFADGLQKQLAIKQATQSTAQKRTARRAPRLPGRIRRFFSGQFVMGTIMVVFLVGFVIWAAVRIFTLQEEDELSPTPPSIAEVLLAPPTATTTASLPAPSPTIPELPPATEQPVDEAVDENIALPESGDAVQVYVTVRQRAWIRVIVDGELEFQGRVLPGNAYQFTGDEKVEILTGNAAALQVFFNQQDLGPMGLFGQVVYRVYTLDGVQTPTPTITLTPTATPRPNLTALPVITEGP
jgi:cytoskeleton protein RodZ